MKPAAAITGLTRDDGHTIGFVLSCLFAGAIDMAELKAWCLHVIERNAPDETPGYVFDLLDHEGGPAKIYQLLGFAPEGGSDDEAAALSGLAIRRGRPRGDFPATDALALATLERRSDVERLFRETFPFIEHRALPG